MKHFDSAQALRSAWQEVPAPVGLTDYQSNIFRLVRTVQPQTCVEIGLYLGDGAEAILLALQENGAETGKCASLVDIDVDPCEQAHKRVSKLELRLASWSFFRGNSSATKPAFLKALGNIDFLYIDGDHSEAAARADWSLFSPQAKVVLLDDIHLDGPGPLWTEIVGATKWDTFDYLVRGGDLQRQGVALKL